MSIKEFGYIDIALEKLTDNYNDLLTISEEIEGEFTNILSESSIDFLNISSRVKSTESLRGKILRNKYYKKYPQPETLIYKLSDLIGVRIECRFVDDEKNIYRYLKRYFNKSEDNIYYYNESNKNFLIKLEGKQPQKQKNGFTIYRIDGKCIWNKEKIPFELQIKSLVNMFWGEIEHEIIYKNSNYIIENEFLKDIMGSIKDNLSMVDRQLVTVFNHFESKNRTNSNTRKRHLEEIVSKSIYDLFYNKMQESLGMTVDFKKSCETIIKYTFDISKKPSENDYTEILIKALKRISEVSGEEIDFNSLIEFERKVKYKDEFTSVLGKYFEKVLNTEFSWNLFFRILFTLEPLDNVGDFEKFLEFLSDRYTESPFILNQQKILKERFKQEAQDIEDDIKLEIARTLVEIDSIEILYEYNISNINDEIEGMYKYISNNIVNKGEWDKRKADLLRELREKIKDAIL